METRHEACSAEGQPRNILECNPNRFAGRCPALSRRCHRVIHSCYAFWPIFRRGNALRIAKSSRAAKDWTADALSSGLTTRQQAGVFCADPEQADGEMSKQRVILSPNRTHARVKPGGMLWRIMRPRSSLFQNH